MSVNIHEDGVFTTPQQEGPWITSTDNEVLTTKYSAPFIQQAGAFQKLALGSLGPLGGSLISEDDFSYPGGIYVRWKRTYAITPPSRYIPEGFVYSFQFAEVINGQNQIVEFPLPVSSYVQYDYFLSNVPTTISLFTTYRLQLINGFVYTIGDAPDPASNFIVGEDSIIRRWAGNIWERSTRYIPRKALTKQS